MTKQLPQLMDECEVVQDRYRWEQLFGYVQNAIGYAKEVSASIIANDGKLKVDNELGWLHRLVANYRADEGPADPSVGIL